MNPHTPSDHDVDRDEREIAALYRRLPKAEPDAALDARVLAQARRAITSSSHHRSSPWLVGLGTAAVLVLAAGVTWRLQPTLQRPPALQSEPAAAARGQADAVEKDAIEGHAVEEHAVEKRAQREADAEAKPRESEVLAKPATSAENLATRSTNALITPAAQTAERSQAKAETRQALPAPRAKAIEDEAGRASDKAPEAAHAPVAPAATALPPPASTSPSLPLPEENAAADTIAPSEQTFSAKPTIHALIDAARAALREGDRAAARNRVRLLLRTYPEFTLPSDLAPLAPAGNEKARHR